MKTGQMIFILCDLELDQKEQKEEGQPQTATRFEAVGALHDNGYFYGFSSDEADDGADYLVTGFYDENLGMSLIRLPIYSEANPEFYRTLGSEGHTEGEFYDVVQKVRFLLLGNIPIKLPKRTVFMPKGNASVQMKKHSLDFLTLATIEESRENYENYLIVPEFREFFKNSFKDEAVAELKADLEKLKAEKESGSGQFGE